MRAKSSPAKRSPSKIGTPIPDDDHGMAKFEDNRGLELQIVDPAASHPISVVKSFELPHDWIVEAKPRWNNPSHIDKTYREPGTGRKFSSILAVQKYLSGEPETPVRRKPVNRALDYRADENSQLQLQIVSKRKGYITDGAAYNLPDGWVVEHVPRRKGKMVDRYYIEPGTGYRLRSLISVERYLAEIRESSNASKENSMSDDDKSWDIVLKSLVDEQRSKTADDDKSWDVVLKSVVDEKRSKTADDDESWDIVLKSVVDEQRSKTAHVSKPSKANTSREKLKSTEEANNPTLNVSSPPEKVKWVLSGPGNLWNPFMGESEVPGDIQQTWSKTFISSIEGRFNLFSS